MSSKKKNKLAKEATNQSQQQLPVQPPNNISYRNPMGPNSHVPLLLQQPPPTNFYQMPYPPIFNNWPVTTNNHSNIQPHPPQQQPQPQPQPHLPSHKGCSLCRREPRFTCARCGAHYCSQECQKIDWPNHRFWCFAMPPLVPLHAVCRTTPPIPPLPKNQSIVLLTGFRRPNLCYVRSLEPSDKEQFAKGMITINNYGTSALLMTEIPACNTYAVAYYERQYNRVQVLSASSEDGIRVLFIDKGYVRTLQLKDLRKAADVVIRILQQAVAVKLKDVPNYMITDEIEEFLAKFEDKEFRLEYGEDDVDREVVLKELNTENTLNECISSFANKQKNLNVYAELKMKENDENGNRKLGAIPKKKETKKQTSMETARKSVERDPMPPVLKPPFELIPFDENDKNFCVKILDESRIEFGLFGCMARNNGKYLDKINAYLSQYVDNGEAYKPELNEYCLASLDNKWCRIKVLNIYKNIYTVINIDTTYEDKIESNKIRRYPDDFKVPCVTMLCKIEGLQPISGNKLILNFMNQRFTINSLHRINRVKKTENGITYVQMDDLIDEFILDFQVNVK